MTTTAPELPFLRQSPVVLNQERARAITKKLVEKLESVLIFAQAGEIAITATVDSLTMQERLALYIVALGFAAWSLVAWKYRGPFAHGGPWTILWLGSAVLVPLVMANLVPPGAYGSSPACTQLCAYPGAPLIIFAFYPWHSIARSWMRPGYELIFLFVVIVEPLVIIMTIQPYITTTNWVSVAVTALLNTTTFIGGKALGRICTTAGRSQFDAVTREYERQINFIHGHVETAIAAATTYYDLSRPADVLATLRQLDDAMLLERKRLYSHQPYVDVSRIARLHMDAVNGDELGIELKLQLPSSVTKVPQPVGELLDQALGDLIKNAMEHGRPPVEVVISANADELRVTVTDRGKGMLAEKLRDPSTNLHELYEGVKRLDGDLKPVHDDHGGTGLGLWVPIEA